MFRKPKRNFRNRRQDSGSDEEANGGDSKVDSPMHVDDGGPVPMQTEPVVKKVKKKKKDKDKEKEGGIHKSASVLSFDDHEEEGGEVFQIKKSSHSRRVAKQLKKESKREKEERERQEREERERREREEKVNTQKSEAGLYSAENLKKLKADQEKENGNAVEMRVGSDADISDFSDEDDEPKRNEPSFSDILRSGQIPDAAMIHMARKRRQQAREQGDGEFIPLDDTEKFDKNKSRLVREDDNDRSDEGEDDRLEFTVNSKEKERRAIECKILAAEEESHSEGSEHEEAWIQEQIRKGVQAGGQLGAPAEDQFNLFGATYGANTTVEPMKEERTAPVPKDLKDISVDQIRKRLQDRLAELVSVHRAHLHEQDEVDTRFDTCDESAIKFQDEKPGLEDQYRFFQEMRGYVRDLVECLNEKMSSILFLERSMNNLLKQRADKFVKRRQEDIKDESVLCSAAKAAAGPSLAGQEASSVNTDPTAQRRAAERDGRRNRRRRVRAELRKIAEHNEGMSTDDEESKSETTKFNLERERISHDVTTMFEDVMEDFHEFHHIKARFEDWKRKQRDSYEEAFIGLCLPKLFTPLVRLYLINWNPLEAGCIDFEEMNWYETLMFYGYEEDSENNPAFPEQDSDLKLMPSLVEKVLLPKITVLVESVWDPLSSQQTKRLVATVRKIIQEYPTLSSDSKNAQTLIKAVVARMKRALDEDVFVPLYPKQALENKNSPQASFFHRQFWSGVKLLQNMMLWEGVVAQKALRELALDGLLNRYLLLALHNSPLSPDLLNKCQAVTGCLPSSWFSTLEGESTLPQLQNLSRILALVATNLHKQANTHTVSDANRKTAREYIRQLMRMLVNIHALDQAATLAEQSCIKM